MLKILSKKLKRQLKLLEYLFEGDTYRFNDLENLLGCSAKTLRNDLLDIHSYANDIKIQMTREEGVKATILPHVTEDYIYQVIKQESIEYRYLEAILLHKFKNYLELADYLFISESTLRRIVDKINPMLQSYDLKVQALIKLVGNDQVITEMTVQFLMEKYHYFEDAFPASFRLMVTQLAQDFVEENNLQQALISLEPQEEKIFHFWIAARILLLQNDNGVVSVSKKQKKFKYEILSNKRLRLPKSNELINEHLASFIFDQAFIFQLFDRGSLNQKNPILFAIDSFIKEVEEKYGILCEDKKKIFRKVTILLQQSTVPFSISYQKNSLFFKNSHSEMNKIQLRLWNKLKHYVHTHHILLNDFEEFATTMFTEILLYWPDLIKKFEDNKQVRALVITNSTLKYDAYLLSELDQQLGNHFEFVARNNQTLSQDLINYENFDCIISNITIDKTYNIPIFGISVFPKAREIHNLINFYQELLA